MSNEITIVVHAHEGRLLWADLRRAIEENIHALNGVGRALSDSDTLPGSWRVEKLSMNSPVEAVLAFDAPPDTELPDQWIPTFVAGMQLLEEREVQPEGFSDEVMANLANLVPLRKRIDSIEYRSNGDAAKTSAVATGRAAAIHAKNKAARPKYYYATGELRGQLGQITAHGRTHEFVIYDELDDHEISCHFAKDELRDVAKAIERRVAVFGKITYDRRDRPIRMEIKSWGILRDDSELASLDEMNQALAPLPQGMSSEDYVRSLREDD